jgi:hypothetical protein
VVCEGIYLGERPPAATTLGKGIHAYGYDTKRRGSEGQESRRELDYDIYATRGIDAPALMGYRRTNFWDEEQPERGRTRCQQRTWQFWYQAEISMKLSIDGWLQAG